MAGVTEHDENQDGRWPVSRPEPRNRGLTHWLILLGFFAGTLLLVALAILIEPDPRGFGTHEKLGLTPCRLMEWTGFPCPGCGVTTSATLAARGELWRSIVVQPFGLLSVVALPLLSLWGLLVHLRGDDLYEVISRRKGRWIKWTLVLLGLAWGYKIVAVTL